MTTALRSTAVSGDVMIHLQSLGQCLISIGATRLAPNARMLFASALFVAVEGRRKVERSKFTETLWPELPESNGTHAMRQMCYRLRTCGMPIEASGARITLPDGIVATDFDDLLDEDSGIATEELLTRIPGGFLPGYMPRVSDPFTTWVEEQRAQVNAALRRRLGAAITERRAAGDWQATEKLAMRCLELDPLNELATLAYAESIAMDGSKARAIAVLDRYSSEIGPASKQIREPMLALRKRIIELYPVPPVIEVEPPQIGREEEMAKLDAALKDAREGRGSAFVISGPPGIGKTRLVTEFTRAAELKGTKIARTSMGRHDDHRPLGAWSDLVPPLRRMPGAVGIDPDSIPYLQRLTSYDCKQTTPSAESQDAEYLFARIRLSIVDLVAAVATESCVILLIEDIHWMDEWSWDVMAALSKKLATTGVLVLMTRRDAEEGSTPIPKDAAVMPMPLQPLSAAFCRKLFGHVGPAKRSNEEDFIDWCVRTSAGNPYFLIELGRRASTADGRFQAPPSLTKLIAERFLDITPLSRRVLQAAAVLGSNSTLRRVESVLDERRISLLDSLDELSRHSLILTEADHLLCRHDLLGMSALSEISQLSLRVLHRHAAETLEREVDASSNPSLLFDCAKHRENAGERDAALMLLERCSERAIKMGIPLDAIRILEYALTLEPEQEVVRERFLRRLIGALYTTRDYARLLEIYAMLERTQTAGANASTPCTPEFLYAVDAEHFSTGPSRAGFDKSRACALDPDASPTFRVMAATIAMKLASNLFARTEGIEIFEATTPLFAGVEDSAVAELEIIFQGSFGSAAACGKAAQDLRRVLKSSENPGYLIRAIGQCAEGLYLGGHIADLFNLIDDGELLATKLWLPDGIHRYQLSRAKYQLALGDTAAARKSLLAWRQRSTTLVDMDRIRDLDYEARLSLLEGDGASAISLLRRLFESVEAKWPRGMAHRTGSWTLARLLVEQWCPTNTEIDELLRIHHMARQMAHHDLYVLALSYAFERRGELPRFVALWNEYVTNFRFERGPILSQLSLRVGRLVGTVELGRGLLADADKRARTHRHEKSLA